MCNDWSALKPIICEVTPHTSTQLSVLTILNDTVSVHQQAKEILVYLCNLTATCMWMCTCIDWTDQVVSAHTISELYSLTGESFRMSVPFQVMCSKPAPTETCCITSAVQWGCLAFDSSFETNICSDALCFDSFKLWAWTRHQLHNSSLWQLDTAEFNHWVQMKVMKDPL